jgi:DNA (cytosine-5)-methyltransferase 1
MTEGRDVSSIMRQVHSRNTTPEIAFRKALRNAGISYRLKTDGLPGKPDLIIPRVRLAVFIDGDYWHGGQWIRRGLTSLEDQFRNSSNVDYWLKKIRGNMRRDAESTAALVRDGWKVLRFWESSVSRDIDELVMKVKHVCDGEFALSGPHLSIPFKTVAEFFAGIGLVRIGLESGNWRVIYANDIDEKKYQMYRDQFGEDSETFDLRDINDVNAGDIPDVTLATASFPCNDTSLAGGRKGLSGRKSSAFWGFIRLLDQMGSRRPPMALIENVTGFLTSGNGLDFESALVALNELGYLVDAFQLDAASFIPQSRNRLFITAVQKSLVSECPEWTYAEVCESPLRPARLADFMRQRRHVSWLIRPLPEPGKTTLRLQDCLEDVEDDSSLWWNRSRAQYLLGQMNPVHRAKAQTIIEGPDYQYGTIFRRVRKGTTCAELRCDGLAGCLRTPRGGSARQILFKGGMGKFGVRLLTARECARLMGAPDYSIKVAQSQALYGFGDAVVVPALEWIATYYLDVLVCQLLRGRVFGSVGK